MIRDEGPVSRSDLSRAIGLPRSTTTALVAELLREGLINEAPGRSGGAGSGSGRPATLLSLRRPDGLVAGFDFGHRHIRVAVATGDGQILAEESMLLDVDRESGAALEYAGELLDVVLERAGVTVSESSRRRRRNSGPAEQPHRPRRLAHHPGQLGRPRSRPRSYAAGPACRSRWATTPRSARSAR